MEQNEVNNRIFKVMSLVLEVPISDINEDSSKDSLENWDSLRHLNLVIALEEEFNVSIPDEEVGNMTNFRLVRLVISDLL